MVYNGKILTPQSLISRKGPANSSGTSTGAYKRPKPEGTVQTIDETNEQLEKPGQLASKLTHKK